MNTLTFIPRMILGAVLVVFGIVVFGVAIGGIGLFMTFTEAFSHNNAGAAFWGHITQLGMAPLNFIIHMRY